MTEDKQEEGLKYCLYARKSTESDEKQAMSIDSQVKEMLDLARKKDLEIGDIRKESHSAKAVGQRPVFNGMMEDINKGKFNAILSWAPDRLSRNAGDLGNMVDLMDNGKLKEVRTHSQVFTDDPNEKFLLMILGSQAKLENDNKSEHVKRGLRAKAEKGLYPCIAPIGYLNHESKDKPGVIIVDPKRGPLVAEAFEKVGNEGWSGRDIYQWFKDEKNFTSRQGGHLGLSSIYRMLKNPFYYGEFEYPKGSGNWYQGKHEPLISKRLYDKVREQCSQRTQYKPADKDFAFTKLMKCGNCGSGITAQEKYKELSNGHTAKYIYYGCSRSQNLQCKERNLREKDLIKQFSNILDDIDLKKSGLKKKLEKEVSRYYKFQNILGKKEHNLKTKEADMKMYAKYILKEGNIVEKRNLMQCLKDKLVIKSKQLQLESVN